ncbi:MAG TPA: hypothetical protein VLM79_21050 [Kofleriaceae bacterium]|nr:hypothetical protein [Kofleriaceae bacterium]
MRSDLVFARQVLPATTAAATGTGRAQSRIIYLNPNGVILYPGKNDSSRDISSVVAEPTLIEAWDTDELTWALTAECVAEIYAPFDVVVTDEDPGDTPHIEAVLGGAPGDVGLADNVAGVSPFTSDCAIIESSMVFAFTDVLPDDPRTICEVISQEIAHSFGLDHERLASDPMTYLDYDGDRTFQDQSAACGEFSDRKCGINGTACRQRQNSVALLRQRLGPHGGSAIPSGDDTSDDNDPAEPDRGLLGGCTAADGSSGCAMALALLLLRRRRR